MQGHPRNNSSTDRTLPLREVQEGDEVVLTVTDTDRAVEGKLIGRRHILGYVGMAIRLRNGTVELVALGSVKSIRNIHDHRAQRD